MLAPPPVVLAAEGLRKSYGARAALKGVSLEAHAGERVACIGPNGAGKTTLLSILAGIQSADAGTVRAEGRPGWVPQSPAVYDRLTPAENLRTFATLEQVEDVDEVVTQMLAQTGLADRAGDQVGRLSGGNRQRLNVAIGLLSRPPVLLLDEPSAALDPRQRERLWAYLARLSDDGTSVLFATHTVSEAERYADRVLVLADGEALFWGPPAELQERVSAPGDLESAFVSFLREQGH
jgi:ABC-2 type transport system ATP-binding protein